MMFDTRDRSGRWLPAGGLSRLPHPIPYQGSKRNLARAIGARVPNGVETWYEPFAGSAAMTIRAARDGVVRVLVA